MDIELFRTQERIKVIRNTRHPIVTSSRKQGTLCRDNCSGDEGKEKGNPAKQMSYNMFEGISRRDDVLCQTGQE